MECDLIIKNGYVLTMDEGRVYEQHSVVIKNGTIVSIVDAEKTKNYHAKKTVDAKGNVIMPGFSNCHTHIGSNILLRGLNEDVKLFEWLQHMWEMKKNFDHETLYYASKLGLVEMLKSGITSFNEHFDAYSVTPEIQALEEIPLRATLGYGFADRGVYEDVNDYSWKTLENFSEIVEKYHKTQNDRLHVALSPHAAYSCGPDLWRLCKEVADKHNISIHTHLSEGMQEWRYVGDNYGLSPTQWLASMGILGPHVTAAHCSMLGQEDIRLLADSNTKVAHCPISNAKLCSGTMPIKEVLEAGICIGLANDGPASHNTLDIFQEIKFAAITHKNRYKDPELLNLNTILEIATKNSALAMHREQTGQIKVGNKADAIVVNTNTIHSAPNYSHEASLVYTCRADDVLHSVVDGRLLMEDRAVAGVDEQELISRLKRNAYKLRDEVYAK